MAGGFVIDVVPLTELEVVWAENNVDAKRASGVLLESIVHRAPARNPRWEGGEARIPKLFNGERPAHRHGTRGGDAQQRDRAQSPEGLHTT